MGSNFKPDLHKNVLLISVDTLRFDTVGYESDKTFLMENGKDLGKLIRTPAIDSLAEKGIVFRRCYTTAPYTTNGHASLLTGCWPHRHGVRSFFVERLSPQVKTLSEMFRESGFRTLHATSFRALFHTGILGFDRGVEDFIDINRLDHGNGEMQALKWMESQRASGQRFFAFYHTNFVHDYVYNAVSKDGVSWTPSDVHGEEKFKRSISLKELASRYIEAINLYDQKILGPFLENMIQKGILDDTIVVFTSDHGEGLSLKCRTHGWGSRAQLCEQNLRVPLIFRMPEGIHRTVDTTVRNIDIFPTLSDLCVPDRSDPVDGISLAPGIEGEPMSSREAYAETWGTIPNGENKDMISLIQRLGQSKDPERVLRRDAPWVLRARCLMWGQWKLSRSYDGPPAFKNDQLYNLIPGHRGHSLLSRYLGPPSWSMEPIKLKWGDFDKTWLLRALRCRMEEWEKADPYSVKSWLRIGEELAGGFEASPEDRCRTYSNAVPASEAEPLVMQLKKMGYID
ncbi:MAG: hypothetical protein A3A86_07455 [Elusimicrobia bacterium RIFCSPLOWO2_01_FULL_60_11]|nr:MAG: hypothetical protein A3A86_07455 [Elusimicrobia bacterium RIFCSPLOWO2_01_FULL_60_11]